MIDTLYKAVARHLNGASDPPAPHDRIDGLEQLDKVIDIDQSPIGRTPRSNPATYTGAFTPIRDWFAGLPEAKARGYQAGRFSFNVKGGRCEACQGDGVIKIEMHFLPDVYVTCDVCKGKRYDRETLEVRYRDKSIADVLDMTVEEAAELFKAVPSIRDKMETLKRVGLGYVKVGQQATTLSGGEAQRVKLAKELARRATGRTLYILDEPTTGLHFHDVAQLLEVLHELVDQGNTMVVIEHNLEVVKTADWIIDMGPEGGDGGGEVVAKGTPEQIVRNPRSHTGAYLKQALAQQAGEEGQGGGGVARGLRRDPNHRPRMSCKSPFAVGEEGTDERGPEPGAAMPTCFVIMGFGRKTDLATGRVLDLDKSYKNMIKPAVIAAGYDCVRADEIQHSGVIDVPMYEMLFAADLVVADLSTANLNAIFELGVRHALKPHTTVIIAESKFTIPFDASHIVVRHYEHLGPDIGFDEVMRMRTELTTLASALKGGAAVDSPVYTVLADLQMPTRPAARKMGMAPPQLNRSRPKTVTPPSCKWRAMLSRTAISAMPRKFCRPSITIKLLPGRTGSRNRPDPSSSNSLRSRPIKWARRPQERRASAEKGYSDAEALLRQLDVETTTDPETLGLWSAIHKQRAEIATRSPDQQRLDLDIAIRAAERGFVIRRDSYNGTNLAFLLNMRASKSSGNDRIADNVVADRIRREVVDITASALATLKETTLVEEKYWIAATHAENLSRSGDSSGDQLMRNAIASAPAPWMASTTQRQLIRSGACWRPRILDARGPRSFTAARA